MKIKNVRVIAEGDFISLWADCEIKPLRTSAVYFKFDKKYAPFIVTDASPFAAALLIPAMQRKQSLVVEGSMSKALYDGMHIIMDTMASWNIGFKPVSIKAERLTEETKTPTKVGSYFSGGVDSFYTYLRHKNEIAAVTHFILIRGYDIPLNDTVLWEETVSNIRNIAKAEGIELVEVESNIRQPIDAVVEWDYSHGGCLAAVGLALRGLFKTIYIPSSYTLEQLFPWGSHPDIDAHWNTETLSFIHDGADCKRVDKVITQVSKSPTALQYLRVCYVNKESSYNCGSCDKCLRTMINLYVSFALDKCATLPHEIDVKKISSIVIQGEHGAVFQRENLEAVKRLRPYPELEAALAKSLALIRTEPSTIAKAKKKILRFDATYLGGFINRNWMKLKKTS